MSADGHNDQAALAGLTKGFPIPDPADHPSLKGKVSDHEWAMRCDLAATYRLVALYGWTDLVFTHISARLPDENGEARFLINPYGVMFDEMTASSLVKIDTEGKVHSETPYFINPAGFTIHSAVHMHRHDATCVIHVHTPYGIAVSIQKQGLRKYSQFAMQVHDGIAYHAYEGIALNLEERDRLVADLGDKNMMILKNHGTLTLGPTCGTAFLATYFLEQACKVQILAQAAGSADKLHEGSDEISALVFEQGAQAFVPGLGDNLVWPGLLRRLKRMNPGHDQ
ncbi:MAG: class II aldolase/adducin family protein [Parvularculaceae bacterium]